MGSYDIKVESGTSEKTLSPELGCEAFLHPVTSANGCVALTVVVDGS